MRELLEKTHPHRTDTPQCTREIVPMRKDGWGSIARENRLLLLGLREEPCYFVNGCISQKIAPVRFEFNIEFYAENKEQCRARFRLCIFFSNLHAIAQKNLLLWLNTPLLQSLDGPIWAGTINEEIFYLFDGPTHHPLGMPSLILSFWSGVKIKSTRFNPSILWTAIAQRPLPESTGFFG